MKMFAMAALAAGWLAQAPATASGQPQQPPPPLPGLVSEVKTIYTNIHNNITKSVEQFPADKLTEADWVTHTLAEAPPAALDW